MLLITLASGLLMVFWVCLALMWIPGLGSLLGQAAAGLTSLMLTGVRTFGSADWLLLWTRQADLLTALGWLLLMAGCCGLWRPKAGVRAAAVLAGALAVIVSLIPWPTQDTGYIQLSMGEADSAVLWDKG